MGHDIPAKSRLFPTIPITSPQFVYRGSRQTDVRVTFERTRIGLGLSPERRRGPGAPADRAGSDLVAPQSARRAEKLPVNRIGQQVHAIYAEAFAVPLRALPRTSGGE